MVCASLKPINRPIHERQVPQSKLRTVMVAFAVLFALSTEANPVKVDARECGAAFSLPGLWTMEIGSSENRESSIRCQVALRPGGWKEKVKRSRWGASDPPLRLTIFSEATTYETALRLSEFESHEDSGVWGKYGGYAIFAPAEPRVEGGWSGLAAYTFYRGFIREDAKLAADESHAFGAEIAHIVLRRPDGRVIKFECVGGTPDEEVDCDPVIRLIAETLKLEPTKPDASSSARRPK